MSIRRGFETLDDEIQVDDLPIEGRIPEWLSGNLIRNGPAKFEAGDDRYRHWFDGLAMLHAFQFREGRVSYANRYLESRTHRETTDRDGIVYAEFGTDPCRSIFKRAMQIFTGPDLTDNASVNIARLTDEYIAMTETPMPVVFDPDTLETEGHYEFDDNLEGTATTAHPHYDFDEGAVYNYFTEYGRTSTYRVFRHPDGSHRREVVAEIEVDPPRYMHSFGMTANYVVLVEFPLVLRPLELLLQSGALADHLTWEPALRTRFQIVDKSSGEVVSAKTNPIFAFHHVNAFEKDGDLVVDLVGYPDADIVERLFLEPLRSGDPGRVAGYLRRYRLEPGSGDVHSERLSDHPLELPRINYRDRNTRPYETVWGVGQRDGAAFADEIVRIDTDDGEALTWHEEQTFPGEPVFVARPEADAEDDGVLLSVVLDAETERSFLLVLDAADLDEIGRAEVPHHIPFGFHGTYASG